jgi:hypothetical protein
MQSKIVKQRINESSKKYMNKIYYSKCERFRLGDKGLTD